MAEQFDPEEWAGIIRRALDLMTGPILRHDGAVAEVRGDGILAYFGAPVTHEDDPQRAIFAGLEILAGIRDFHAQIQLERQLDFEVRVGVHTGLVVVEEVGGVGNIDYTAIGDTVNLAARMEQTARPGTLQISEHTYKFIEQLFDCEPLGEIQVKGKHQPIRAYRVIGIKAEPGPARGLERQGLQSPLVGREAELSTLSGAIERLLAGQGSIIALLGEAGIGKSRLASEIRAQLPEDRLIWLEGHTLSFGETISYWPFQEILRHYAGISGNDGEEAAWSKLESKVHGLFSDNTAEILPYLASLLELPVKGDYAERVKYLDGEQLGKQVFLATRRFFERLANERPLVLVFEDLHWIDDSSLGLLEHLLPLVESAPLLVLCLSRSDPDTTNSHLRDKLAREYPSLYGEILLSPLSPDDSRQLVHNLLEIEDLPSQMRQMIVGKAEGNPFFVEEILRGLIDLGAVRRDPISGHWRATEAIEQIRLPDTIQGVILARMDRLEEGVKNILREAAVIGRAFLYRVLKAVAEAGDQLDDHLRLLQSIQIIQERQRLPELEYLFKHALAQETVYESILLQKRRALHARVGQVIETLFADRLEEFYGLLAHHYAMAEAWEKAQAYLLKAADQAGQLAADAEALAHYQQAKAAYARVFGDRWDPVERAALERKMAEAFARIGEHREALEYFRRALAYLGQPFPASPKELRRALLPEILEQIGRAFLPVLFRSRQAGPLEEEILRIYQSLQFVMGPADQQAYLLLSVKMLNFSQRYNLAVGISMASSSFGSVFSFLHLLRLAAHYNHQAIHFAEQLQRPDAIGFACTAMMLQEGLQAHWEATFQYSRRAAEAFRKTGDLRNWSVSNIYAGNMSTFRGDFTRGLQYGQELLRFGIDSGDRAIQSGGLIVLGMAEQRLGDLEQAIRHSQQAIELSEVVLSYFGRVDAGNTLGLCYLGLGQWQEALEVLEANRRFILEHNMRRNPYRNLVLSDHFTEAYLQAAEQDDSGKRRAWLKEAGHSSREALKFARSHIIGRAEAQRLQGNYEWLSGNPSKAQDWWQKSLSSAESLGLRHESGLTHLEIGRRLGERAHLEQAEAIFAETKAKLDLAKARELINGISS